MEKYEHLYEAEFIRLFDIPVCGVTEQHNTDKSGFSCHRSASRLSTYIHASSLNELVQNSVKLSQVCVRGVWKYTWVRILHT